MDSSAAVNLGTASVIRTTQLCHKLGFIILSLYLSQWLHGGVLVTLAIMALIYWSSEVSEDSYTDTREQVKLPKYGYMNDKKATEITCPHPGALSSPSVGSQPLSRGALLVSYGHALQCRHSGQPLGQQAYVCRTLCSVLRLFRYWCCSGSGRATCRCT